MHDALGLTQATIYFIVVIFMCMGVLPACVSVYVPGAFRSQIPCHTVIIHAFNPSTQESRQEDLSEF